MAETVLAWQAHAASGGIEMHLTLDEIPTLADKPIDKDELLIQVYSASINPVDYKLLEVPIAGKLAVGFPSTPGLDFLGKVIKSGTLVDSVRNGQLVFGRLPKPSVHGSLGEQMIAPVSACCPVPDSDVKSEDRARLDQYAAFGTAGLTAYQCIAPFTKKGDRIFINGGSGGTGSYGIQIARNLGLHITVSCSSKNAEFCKQLGAEEVLAYDQCDILTSLRERAAQFGEFDHVVDNIGSPRDLYKASSSFLKESGHFVQVGVEQNIQATLNLASRKLLPSFLGGGTRKFHFLFTENKLEDFRQCATWISEGKLEVNLTTFKRSEAVEAFNQLKSRRTQGKIIVRMHD
ncbi:hypothetical protein BCR37DRAFT_345292 [Protomyces lactucae-debilis]|uniref:Enoyl reductase (ER) domain-containing protein n=1 Tax=Protomyces lactucae-debilis TaxID=2754530 RepID=A0A1Y2FLZ3_PROLT|nr:uncharacterized protein BCR37DRAFT_345292 [Protomyces lactucae-debilis]ORY84993.1 hypothetical protein BCR37DRAFT_345292 [Protomyces lactucae-debilis]